ncbi:MAG: TetR/AcrR family transcriptional regulator [Lachnospiraceae bacterium]|nr:TetR/AcrR family transcriptional regulator [Lachnospiraceae bacterium]
MPKIILNLREQIISTGRVILQEEGYKALNMRRIADECQIAVGTVYNYFSSKEILSASVMLTDWQEYLEDARKQVEIIDIEDPAEGLEILFLKIRAFSNQYHSAWVEYGVMPQGYSERHVKLVSQLGELVQMIVKKCGIKPEPEPYMFMAEVLLTATYRPDVKFENLKPFFIKLIN